MMDDQPTLEELWALVKQQQAKMQHQDLVLQRQQREIAQVKATHHVRRWAMHPLLWRCLLLLAVVVWAINPGVSLAMNEPASWVSIPNASTPVADSTTVAALDGTIYTIGEGSTSGCSPSGNNMQRYDPATNTWEDRASNSADQLSGFVAAAVGPDGRIFEMGGYFFHYQTSTCAATNVAAAYTPSSDTWTALPSMPTPRYELAAATGPDGNIYAIGGTSGSTVFGTVERYSPSTNSWATMPSLHHPRYGLEPVTGTDGKIYAMGGYDATNAVVATVERYDTSAKSWTDVTPMLQKRVVFGASLGPDGRIYAIAGSDGGAAIQSVEAYSTATNTWSWAAPLPSAEYELSAALGGDGRIYAVSGADATGNAGAPAYAYTATSGEFDFGSTGIEGLTPGAMPESPSTTAGVYGGAIGSTGYGVEGVSTRYAGVYGHGVYGLYGTGTYGVLGQGTYGVYGTGSSSGRGGVFSGGAANIRLPPAGTTTKPASPQLGDLWVDSTGALWYYGSSGWKQIG